MPWPESTVPTIAPGRYSLFSCVSGLGLTSFGGPVAHLGYFRAEFVTRRGWLTERAYADLVALCQFLPGPASSQVGMVGAVARGLLWCLGCLGWLYAAFGDCPDLFCARCGVLRRRCLIRRAAWAESGRCGGGGAGCLGHGADPLSGCAACDAHGASSVPRAHGAIRLGPGWSDRWCGMRRIGDIQAAAGHQARSVADRAQSPLRGDSACAVSCSAGGIACIDAVGAGTRGSACGCFL